MEEPKVYRRKDEQLLWHFEPECSKWPNRHIVEQQLDERPAQNMLCRHCLEIEADRIEPVLAVSKEIRLIDPEKPVYKYRRRKVSLKWHIHEGCRKWPVEEFIELETNEKFTQNQICPKCIELDRIDSGSQDSRKKGQNRGWFR